MNAFIFLLIGLGAGFGAGYAVAVRRCMNDPTRDPKMWERARALVREKSEMTKADLQKGLGVGEAVASRLLKMLEETGDAVKAGMSDAGEIYRRK